MVRILQTALFITLCLTTPAALSAQGIRFDQIQTGTEYRFKGESVHFISRYAGVENGQHVILQFFARSGKLFQIKRYDANGRLVQIVSLGFKNRHVFEPFHCRHSGKRHCAHKVTLYKDGQRMFANTVQFETRRSGKSLTVIKNADSNRLKTRYALDPHGMIVRKRQTNSQFADNWELVEKRLPDD